MTTFSTVTQAWLKALKETRHVAPMDIRELAERLAGATLELIFFSFNFTPYIEFILRLYACPLVIVR